MSMPEAGSPPTCLTLSPFQTTIPPNHHVGIPTSLLVISLLHIMEKYLGSVLPFLGVVEAVKTLPRTGWGLRGVPNPEHVGDHMYQMAMICMACPNVCHKRSHFQQFPSG